MGVVPTEELVLHELKQQSEKLDRVIELLEAMNGNLASIKSNTRKPILSP